MRADHKSILEKRNAMRTLVGPKLGLSYLMIFASLSCAQVGA